MEKLLSNITVEIDALDLDSKVNISPKIPANETEKDSLIISTWISKLFKKSKNMSYNLRARLMRDDLLETLYDEADNGGDDSDADDNSGSDLEHDLDMEDCTTDDEDRCEDTVYAPPTKRQRQREEEQNALDDTPLCERISHLRRRSRGRPVEKLYGKGGKKGVNKFVWCLKKPLRHSGLLYTS
ncbi:hypothetical protein PV328_011777 [Microctonus aethiopoides]|uniref:Uncharacterized protein n=1 Tax=Microctonus aethiopoides TaxID=144406 RepID=A0AA39FHE3_9HYME|nr:hypothetical protein PV328_011777 [Microctonus aethiopoides]